MISINKRLLVIIASISALLLTPLLAMQFTSEVQWNYADFLIAGIILSLTGIAIEYCIRKIKKNQLRRISILGVFILLVLFWMELAVGIFGTILAGS